MKPTPSTARAALLAVLLAWLAPRAGRAEDQVGYKYQHYREGGGRVHVDVRGAVVEKNFGTATKLKVEGILDSMAGATPNGRPVTPGTDPATWFAPGGAGVAQFSERREAWNAELSHQFSRVTLALGAGNSDESDYVSDGWSVNTAADFNQKNTTVLFGVAGTKDRIKVFHQAAWERKITNDVILGITQLLNPHTSIGLNFTWGQQRGYLNDPYKLVQKATEVFPGVFLPLTFAENRPGEREKWIGLVTLNRTFPELRGAIDASYRLYYDTYETLAHTIDVTWFQRIGEKLILRPGIRFYDQTAAEFYHYRLDGTSVAPLAGRPRPRGPFYSSDYRLSEMQTFNFGLKAVWTVTDAWQIDAAYERYEMRGTDGITPQPAYPDANIMTLGVKFSW